MRRSLILLGLALGVGCAPPPVPLAPDGTPLSPAAPAMVAERHRDGGLSGTVSLPGAIVSQDGRSLLSNNSGTLLSNNSGTLLSNNSGTLLSNNSGTLLSNNSGTLVATGGGNFRVQAAADLLGGEGYLTGAYTYLTDRDERFYLNKQTGRVFATISAEQGRYGFPIVPGEGFPVGKDVIVHAVINGAFRLGGYLVPGEKGQVLELNLASTLATEFLRGEARRLGRALSSFDMQDFRAAVEQTKAAIASGDIAAVAEVNGAAVGTFDLRTANVEDLRNQYAVAIARTSPDNARLEALSDLWKKLLGYRTAAITTPIADAPRAAGLAVSRRGDVFVGGEGEIRWYKPRAGGYDVAKLWLGDVRLLEASGLAVEREPGEADPPGTLLVTDAGKSRLLRVPIVTGPSPQWPVEVLAGQLLPDDMVYGRSVEPFHPFWIDETGPARSFIFADSAKTSSWRLWEEGPRTYAAGNLAQKSYLDKGTVLKELPEAWRLPAGAPLRPNAARYATLREPRNVVVDELGNIYFADAGNLRIRMIPRAAGSYFGYRKPLDQDDDGVVDGFASAPARMEPGCIYTIAGNPAWDPAATPGDSQGHWVGEKRDPSGQPAGAARLGRPVSLQYHQGYLYFSDAGSNMVLRFSRASGLLERVAGIPTGDLGEDPAVKPVAGAAFGAVSSLAIDRAGRVYVSDIDTGRVRRIDPDGTIRAVAGRFRAKGASPTDRLADGDALTGVDLFELGACAIDADENLVFLDRRNGRVRKLWRPWD